jgi:hypothetical protein
MNEHTPVLEVPFDMHMFRLHGPKRNPTVRVLLIATNTAQTVYEGSASWTECRGWIRGLSSAGISIEELAVLRNVLGRKRLATIKEVRVSLNDLELLGLHRADG